MCKTETFKTLTTIKRLEIKGNSFYLGFYRSTLRQAKRFMSNKWCVFATVLYVQHWSATTPESVTKNRNTSRYFYLSNCRSLNVAYFFFLIILNSLNPLILSVSNYHALTSSLTKVLFLLFLCIKGPLIWKLYRSGQNS